MGPLLDSGLLQRFSEGLEPVYRVTDGRELDAAYYRNNAIHRFHLAAIADVALARVYLTDPEADPLATFDHQLLELRKLLQWEFFFPPAASFREAVARDLDLRHPAWRDLVAGGKDGLRTLFLELRPVLGHACLEPYLAAYQVVAEQLAADSSAGSFDKQVFLRRCLNTGRQLLLQRRVVSGEAIGKLLFENGLKVAGARLLITAGDADSGNTHEARQQFAADMRLWARSARSLRSLASARRDGVLS